MISYCRRYWKCFVWAACALAAACGLIWLSRSGTGFAQWYAEYLFPVFPNTIGRLLSPLPFSVYEWVLWAYCAFWLCWCGTCSIAGKKRKKCCQDFFGCCFVQGLPCF